jgi:CRP-like cAMP-binding protein
MLAYATQPTAARNRNNLLAALPAADYDRVARLLDLVTLRLGDMLYEPGKRQTYAYFPTTAVVSLYFVMESGASAESAGVGRDGVVGVSLIMGGDSSPGSAVVQIAGQAYRLDAVTLKQELDRAGPMQQILLRYVQTMMAQMAQTAACNRHHTVEQQLCRWLLVTLDRVPSGEVVVTQEMIAAVLGVRRESITEAAGSLQRSGLIRYRRGHIAVVDRSGLARAACECYAAVATESRRLIPAA